MGLDRGNSRWESVGAIRVARSTCAASHWLFSSGKPRALRFCTPHYHGHPTVPTSSCPPAPANAPPPQARAVPIRLITAWGADTMGVSELAAQPAVSKCPTQHSRAASALPPNSQGSVPAGTSFHSLFQGLFPSSTSSQRRSSSICPRDALPAADLSRSRMEGPWGSGMPHSVPFHSLKRSQSVL